MSSKLLRDAGEALYGPRWQSELARDLNVSDRTMRRWVADGDVLPPGVALDLLRLVLECAQELDDLIEHLKIAAVPAGPVAEHGAVEHGATKPIALIHFTPEVMGGVEFLIEDGAEVRVLVVDERCPHDRIYEVGGRATVEEISKIIGDDDIGSQGDGRHAAIKERLLAGLDDRPHLTIVRDEDDAKP